MSNTTASPIHTPVQAEAIFHNIVGTPGDDTWLLTLPGYYGFDGLAGNDTIDFGTALRSDFTLSHDGDGTIRIDSISGASGAFHATLHNVETLVFNNDQDKVDLTTLFGDIVPPTLTAESPADGARGVAAAAPITLSFSEAIKFGGGSIVLKSGLGDVVETYDIGHSANLSIAGNVLTIHPSHAFAADTTYTLAIDQGAVQDMSGNAFAGADPFSFTTATGANHAPTGIVSIAGTAQQGQVLGAASTLADADGLGTLHYQWTAYGSDIAGATGSTLALTADLVDTAVGVTVSYVDGQGGVEHVSSAPTAQVGGVYTGTDGNDTLYGSGGDDLMSGGAGDDLFVGGYGNDQIDGGSGTDTARYNGNRADFTVTPTASGLTVADHVGGAGTDTLTNIERVVFDDLGLAFDVDGVGGAAYRIYQAAFDRTPDAAGLGYWIHAMDGGTPLGAVAAAFTGSDEWVKLYGANPASADLVHDLYENILHRAPDAGGASYWSGVLDSHAASVPQVLAAFSESAENQAALVAAISQGVSYIPFYG